MKKILNSPIMIALLSILLVGQLTFIVYYAFIYNPNNYPSGPGVEEDCEKRGPDGHCIKEEKTDNKQEENNNE